MMILGILLVLLVVSFLFAGIEAGILSLNRVRLRHRLDQGDASAAVLSSVLEAPGRALTTVLIVTNLCNIGALALGTRMMVDRLGSSGYWATLLIALPVYLFCMELLPKSLFRRFPYRALAALARVLQVATWVLQPLWFVVDMIRKLRGGSTSFRGEKSGKRGIFVAREEVKSILSEGERMGTLSPMERELIHGVVDFRNVKAGDLMVPIDQVVAVTPDTPIAEMIRISKDKQIDRLPIVGDHDEIIGLANIFEVLMDQRPNTGAAHYLRRIVVAKEKEPAFQVIRRLRAARLSLAAVVNAEGKSVGILGTEDIVASLVKITGRNKV